MAALALQLTTAGLAAVRAPAGTEKTVIAKLGLTARPFVAAPTLTALPGEFKRLDILSGMAAAPTVAHITAYDTSADTWSATGFGLFLEDDTLFASFSAAAPVLSKAGVAFALMAFDIAFNADVLAQITFGDATFVWPPATESTRGIAALATDAEVKAGTDASKIVTPVRLKALLDASAATEDKRGLAEIGTQAEVDAGADDTRFVTPKKLAARLTALLTPILDTINTTTANVASIMASLGNYALKAVTITGAGLATGGGNLTANRTIAVTEATAAEITAGASAASVVTPRRLGPITMLLEQNGFIRFFGFQVAWGRFTAGANASTAVVFVQEFPSACFSAVVSGVTNLGSGSQDNNAAVIASSITKAGFSVYSADDEANVTCYIAVGY